MIIQLFLCYQIFVISILRTESSELKSISSYEVDINKRHDKKKLNLLIEQYDQAVPDSTAISHPDCAIPFYYLGTAYNCYRMKDNETTMRCSTKTFSNLDNRDCLKRAPNISIANPLQWKPPSSCVPIFAYRNYYYKGCAFYGMEKDPWCFHDIVSAGRWSYCKYLGVDGKWNEWRQWSDCKMPCGEEFQNRSRSCNNDTPMTGEICVGEKNQSRSCNNKKCPRDMKKMLIEDDILIPILLSTGAMLLSGSVIAAVMIYRRKTMP